MKFDCIIMNPPYDRSLHLKILAEAITHLKDSESKVVNLSPVRWLQDPLAKFKKNSDFHKFEESVSKHIDELDIIDSAKSGDLFHAGIMTDLGIYECSVNTNTINRMCENSVVDKVIASKCTMMSDVVEYKKRDGWRWQISEMQPLNAQGGKYGTYGWYRRFCIFNHLRSTVYFNGCKDGKDWTCFTSGIASDNTNSQAIPFSFRFNSEQEAINCENSVKTNYYKYYVLQVKSDQHTPFKFLPWMGNSLNPRTGKLGYESEWTDDDFRKFFGITDEEWKTIETTMEKFK